jgi:5'-3' exonuclease
MTITGLKRYLLKKRGCGVGKISYYDMHSKRVVIDANCFIYKAKSAQLKNIYSIQTYYLRMINNLLENNIKFIFVFDGLKSCSLKQDEQIKRLNDRKKQKNKIDGMTEATTLLKEIKKILSLNPIFKDVFERSIFSKQLSLMEVKLKKSIKNYNTHPTISEKRHLVEFLKKLNVGVIIIDNHDAENLCCYMGNIGLVDYIFSTDSDCMMLSHKVPYIYDYNNTDTTFSYLNGEMAMKSLNYKNIEQFHNFCILLGTDYAKRIRGNGPVTSNNKILSSLDNGNSEVVAAYGKDLIVKIKNEITYNYGSKKFLNQLLSKPLCYKYNTDDEIIYNVDKLQLIKLEKILSNDKLSYLY